MLDLSFWELALVGMVALLVIGPKELPNALRHLGRITGKARAMTRHVRSGFDEMVRQAEMEEMEREWRQHNARIMAAHPDVPAGDAGAHADAVPVDPMALPPEPAPGEPAITEPKAAEPADGRTGEDRAAP